MSGHPGAPGSPWVVLGADAGFKLVAVPGHVLGQLVDDGLDVRGRRDDGCGWGGGRGWGWSRGWSRGWGLGLGADQDAREKEEMW